MSDNLEAVRSQFLEHVDGLLRRDLRRIAQAGEISLDEKPYRTDAASFAAQCSPFMTIVEKEIDFAAFDAWWAENDYRTRFPVYSKTYSDAALLEKKAFEHWISLQETSDAPVGKVVDMGCATSPFSELVQQDVDAVEICYRADLPLREYGFKPGIHGNVIGCSADDIPLPDKSVARIYSHNAIEHFEGQSYTGFFKESGRLLQKGGTLLVVPLFVAKQTFTFTSIAGIYRRLSFPYFMPGIIKVYSDKVGQPYALQIDPGFLQTQIVERLAKKIRFELIRYTNNNRDYGVELALKGTKL